MPTSEQNKRRRLRITINRRLATREETARIETALDRLIAALVQQHLAHAAASEQQRKR